MKKTLATFVPLTFKRCGVRRVAITESPHLDPTLLEVLGRAFYWQHLLDQGKVSSGADIARREDLDQSVVNVLLRLTLLAPDLIEQLMAGRRECYFIDRYDILPVLGKREMRRNHDDVQALWQF